MYIHIYIYIYVYISLSLYIYIYIERERERDMISIMDRAQPRRRPEAEGGPPLENYSYTIEFQFVYELYTNCILLNTMCILTVYYLFKLEAERAGL